MAARSTNAKGKWGEECSETHVWLKSRANPRGDRNKLGGTNRISQVIESQTSLRS